jgi:hypothetical protein
MPHYSYQVFKNLAPETNPKHIEGKSEFTYLAVAYCATPGGPVDARGIKGLEKNYDTVAEFLDACTEAGYLVKESSKRYDEDGEEIIGSGEPEPPAAASSTKKKSKK